MLNGFWEDWNRYWHQPIDLRILGKVRAAFFALAIFNYFFFDAQHFHVERLPELEPLMWNPISFFKLGLGTLSANVLLVLKYVWAASLVASSLGVLTRAATIVAAVLGLYLIGLFGNFSQFPLREYVFAFSLIAFALLPAGAYFSLDSKWRAKAPPSQPVSGWPVWLLTNYFLFSYFLASLQKAIHTELDYVTTPFLQMLFLHYELPLGMFLAQYWWLCRLLGLATLILEFSAIFAIFKPRWRPPIAVSLLIMHLMIENTVLPRFFPHFICFVWFFIPAPKPFSKEPVSVAPWRKWSFVSIFIFCLVMTVHESVYSRHNWPFMDMKFFVFRYDEEFWIGNVRVTDSEGKSFDVFDDELTEPLDRHVISLNMAWNHENPSFPAEDVLKMWKNHVEKNLDRLGRPRKLVKIVYEKRHFKSDPTAFDWENPLRIETISSYSDAAAAGSL